MIILFITVIIGISIFRSYITPSPYF